MIKTPDVHLADKWTRQGVSSVNSTTEFRIDTGVAKRTKWAGASLPATSKNGRTLKPQNVVAGTRRPPRWARSFACQGFVRDRLLPSLRFPGNPPHLPWLPISDLRPSSSARRLCANIVICKPSTSSFRRFGSHRLTNGGWRI